MKSIILAVLLIILLSACRADPLQPPYPHMTAGNEKLEYIVGGYSWRSNGSGVVADATEPSAVKAEVNEVAVGDTVTIDFDQPPNSLEAGIWKNHRADMKTIDDGRIALPKTKGAYIYVIHATFEQGRCDYYLTVKTK